MRAVALSAVFVAASAVAAHAQPEQPEPAPPATPTPATKKAPKPAARKLDRKAVNELIAGYDLVQLHVDGAGEAQSLGLGVGTELVQILGEIVVDRATAEAYRLIESKVATALSCDKSPALRETCEVITSIRIEDLASAPGALRNALMADATRLIVAELQNTKFAAHYAVLLKDIVIPALARPGSFDTTLAATIVQHVIRYALDHRSEYVCNAPSARSAFILAGLAVAACESAGSGRECPIAAIIETLKCPGADWSSAADRARSLAAKMLASLHARSGPGPSDIDVRARIRSALEVVFDDLCAQADATLGCSGTGRNARNAAILRAIALGALDGDTNAMVAAVIRYAKAALSSDKDNLKRGLRIVAALLDYASTYVPEQGAFDTGEGAAAVAKSAHQKRKKILESLTAEMTNRTERGGDCIVSAGGSLRGVVGRRLRDGHDDPNWMPLQLTLGFAVDKLWQDSAHGLHFELGVLDLGQYLAFDEEESVREPDFADALSPSATVAFFWGRSLPFQVGVTGAYAPQYEYADGKRGSWSIGGTAGIYVPLFDIN